VRKIHGKRERGFYKNGREKQTTNVREVQRYRDMEINKIIRVKRDRAIQKGRKIKDEKCFVCVSVCERESKKKGKSERLKKVIERERAYHCQEILEPLASLTNLVSFKDV
jgi:hypothetical protein